MAEALGNPTCKKIIDYLSDNSGKSEEDIAKAMGMKLNTLEYNLKKLLDSGLVEKTKSFFWSKKGKKIPLYKLANKHIIISPKSTRPSIPMLKAIIPVIISIILIIAIIAILSPPNVKQDKVEGLRKFSSSEELNSFLKENTQSDVFGTGLARGSVTAGAESSLTPAQGDAAFKSSNADSAGAEDYSETNIQVAGVDEADIVKNDGKYIYTIVNNKVVILNAYPAESMEILSEINITNPINIFVNKDKLIVFSSEYSGVEGTSVRIYDISDRENPVIEKEISVEGYYIDSRMIDNYVYLIANKYASLGEGGGVVLPAMTVDGIREKIAPTDIGYFPYHDSGYAFTKILAVNVDDQTYNSETYLLGSSYTIYVSKNNLYLTSLKTIRQQDYFKEAIDKVIRPLLPTNLQENVTEILESEDYYYEQSSKISEIVQDYSQSLIGKEKAEFDKEFSDKMEEFTIDMSKKTEKTIVHKIELKKEQMEYITNGEVPGTVLNQFSMDEYNGYFRIATTTGNFWSSRAPILSHLYVLDENLKTVGSVEDLAKGERIYSVRFMGEKAYVVTFRQVDPLFVISLENPEAPEVLGQLKVTGYSSYLHPYDENLIIGIGKEATEEGRVQGLKIALFDVSDVANPVLKANYEFKEQWSDSNALYNHKAFLFDKEKGVLVLPISYSIQTGVSGDQWRYPMYKYWQGAFVFNINENEITLRGKIDHETNSNESYYYGPYTVERSLYMDNVLYTVSKSFVKANDLDSLDELNSVKLPYEVPDYRIMYGAEAVVSSVDAMVK